MKTEYCTENIHKPIQTQSIELIIPEDIWFLNALRDVSGFSSLESHVGLSWPEPHSVAREL